MSKKVISCGVIPVFIEKNQNLKFLLIQHKNGLHWGFPKGHQEKNENFLETALRELKEETQIYKINIFDKFFIKEFYSFQDKNSNKINKTVIYFLGITKDKRVNIQKQEINSFIWANEKIANEKIKFKETRKILNKTLTFLNQTIISK